MDYEAENKAFAKWWDETTNNGDGSWTSLERLAAHDAWMECARAHFPEPAKDARELAECPADLMEQLAAIEHERWSGQALTALHEMTDERRDRWSRLAKIPYAELDEHNKELDRLQVREYWPLVVSRLAAVSEGYADNLRELNARLASSRAEGETLTCDGCVREHENRDEDDGTVTLLGECRNCARAKFDHYEARAMLGQKGNL